MSRPIHHDEAAAAMAVAEAERGQDDARRALESRQGLAYLLGRIFMGALFLVTAGAKVLRFEDSVAALRDLGMYDSHLLLPVAIAVEAIGAVFLLAGYKVRRIAVGLSVYLVIVTFLVSFDLASEMNANSAVSNLGIMAGLLMLAAYGAGKGSVDAAIERRNDLRFSA
jgi:putative oxidoreductase